jgi:hypothetical protein
VFRFLKQIQERPDFAGFVASIRLPPVQPHCHKIIVQHRSPRVLMNRGWSATANQRPAWGAFRMDRNQLPSRQLVDVLPDVIAQDVR